MHKFVDAQAMAKTYPGTFEAPTEDELKNLKLGQYVKLCHNEERFWVEIVEFGVGDRVSGIIDNDLVNEQPFDYDDKVDFLKLHIYSILDKNDEGM